MNILIPQIRTVKLFGFHPIFKDTVEFNINDHFYMILGGNGLGKTTILQSIIYALGGPANENIESKENKARRWGRDYFKERLDDPNEAFIEVGFKLGEDNVILIRGFKSDSILKFYLNDKLITDDKKDTDDFFEQYIQSEAGYDSVKDFNFIVHKLCYLSEKRENLAWDLEGQTRILMQIFSDLMSENVFRDKRAQLKEIDSKIRHTSVDINWLNKQIISSSEDNNFQEKISLNQAEKKLLHKEINVNELQLKLIEISSELSSKQKEYQHLRTVHSDLTDNVEVLREKITQHEQAFLFEHLNHIESNEAKLAIHKLIHRKLCPSCGSKSESLHQAAINYIKESCCPLCGTSQLIESDSISPNFEAELSEKLNSKIDTEKNIIRKEKEIEQFQSTMNAMNIEVNNYLLSKTPTVIYIDKSANSKSDKLEIENYKNALQNKNDERNTLEIQFNKLQEELDDEYENFNKYSSDRVELLSSLYEKYATEFLGIKCTLQQIESSDKFLNLKLFVPEFSEKVRRSPDSCSEAQRFFLDIAFRMALIQLAGDINNQKGSFICETPESALDITYVNNVADMFEIFSLNSKNTLLMTSNIQSGGIAKTMLAKIKNKKKRKKYFLNMIAIGNLSEVQSSEYGLGLLNDEIKKIIEED